MIVIINKHDGLAHAIRTSLENAGFETILAGSVEDALMQSSHLSPRLILLGETAKSLYQASSLLRANPQTAHVPIILQSDNFGLLNEEYRLRIGAQAVLGSHFSGARLVQELSRFLNLAQ